MPHILLMALISWQRAGKRVSDSFREVRVELIVDAKLQMWSHPTASGNAEPILSVYNHNFKVYWILRYEIMPGIPKSSGTVAKTAIVATCA
jgi:hypothetical protein